MLPSSIPNRFRRLAGTIIAPLFPTLADCIQRLLARLYHLPELQAPEEGSWRCYTGLSEPRENTYSIAAGQRATVSHSLFRRRKEWSAARGKPQRTRPH